MKHFKHYSVCLMMMLLLSLQAVKPAAAQTVLTSEVTLGAPMGTISKNIWGVDFQSALNFPPVIIDNFYGTYIRPSSIQALGAKMYRFPGGCGADSYDLTTGNLMYTGAAGAVSRQYFTIDIALSIASNVPGSELLYQVNINGTDMAGAASANVCGETSQVGKDTTALLADITAMLNNPAYASIRYFELGNSQWFNWTHADYAAQALKFSQAIKTVRPDVKVGLIGYPSYAPATQKKTDWNSMINITRNLSTCGASGNVACFDFVTDHQYPRAQHISNPPFNGQAAYFSITNQDRLPGFMAPYSPKEYAMTEWNLSCGAAGGNAPVPMTNTVDHGFFTVTNLFQMAAQNVSIANYHDFTVNSGTNLCGLFSDPVTMTAAGQAFALSSVAAGGERYDATYVFAANPNNLDFLTIPQNTGCTDPDCIVGGNQVSILSTFAVKQGNDLYFFLLNRSDMTDLAHAAVIEATLNIPIWVGYDKQVIMDQLYANAFNAGTFLTATQTIPNQTTAKILATVPPISISRIRIVDHFIGAPPPTPSSAALPSLDHTIIQKMINANRSEIRQCTQDIWMFIVAAAVYIMVIHFAIAIKEDFKLNLHITCFVIGGAIGYYLCHLDVGFVLAVVLSLFLW